jgi:hypothetical protein
MREQLLGYLMGALEPEERDRVERQIRHDAALQQELELLHESLQPLAAAADECEPPPGLAERTCLAVAQERRQVRAAEVQPVELPASYAARWSLADLAAAAGIIIAAGMLLFPAIQYSRTEARIAECQNNLKQIWMDGLSPYAQYNRGMYPRVPTMGNRAAAGMYAVTLAEGEYLPADGAWSRCPGTSDCQGTTQPIPTEAQLLAASGARLAELRRTMGGDYGYNLGYLSPAGSYQPVRQRGSSTYAIMADAPCRRTDGRVSANHGRCGQNVLYDDGHIAYEKQCCTPVVGDDFYRNDQDRVAAGLHIDDAVIAASNAPPLPE